jgi:hypothetical protein
LRRTILDLQVTYDGKPQTIKLVALDGVPVGSQDGTQRGKLIGVTDFRLPPASRVEFILTGPSQNVKSAQFLTQAIDTGRDGDNDTQRTLANIQPVGDRIGADATVNARPSAPWRQRFEGLASATVTARRKLYFSENADQTKFFITVDGQTPAVFSPPTLRPSSLPRVPWRTGKWKTGRRRTTNSTFIRSISWSFRRIISKSTGVSR